MVSAEEVIPSQACVPPSIANHLDLLLSGRSYSHFSDVPTQISQPFTKNVKQAQNESDRGSPCVLGVDEAGRGPVIGPMVYGVFYLPVQLEHSLLAETHHFDDSKVLTPVVRAELMRQVCTPDSDLYNSCGWAVRSLSAQAISTGMLKNGGPYNLNAQAMDATIDLIRGVVDRGVNVREIYVDTIGVPAIYQKKLERIFPTIKITVEKKADSLFPCVSAASVVAKVTRDVSCEQLYERYINDTRVMNQNTSINSWGSGYPSDSKCVTWLKDSIDPVFGWGSECRFSWGTVKDMLEVKKSDCVRFVDWPTDAEDDNMKMSHFLAADTAAKMETDELRDWYGTGVGQDVF